MYLIEIKMNNNLKISVIAKLNIWKYINCNGVNDSTFWDL